MGQSDEFGFLHQMPWPEPSDFAPRYSYRFEYYLQSGTALSTDPAYVGALQTALRRRGYYGGRSDGVFSQEVRFAIERMQKNHAQPVTGTLTVSVRRALHLP
ncbi:MAG: peptidoglycan-binding domain-containing protein [Bryobacteraceae bacterium]